MTKNNKIVILFLISLISLFALYLYMKHFLVEEIKTELTPVSYNEKVLDCKTDITKLSKENMEKCQSLITNALIKDKIIEPESLDNMEIIQNVNNAITKPKVTIKDKKIFIPLNGLSLNSCFGHKIITYYLNSGDNIEIEPYTPSFVIGCTLELEPKKIIFFYSNKIQTPELQEQTDIIKKYLIK